MRLAVGKSSSEISPESSAAWESDWESEKDNNDSPELDVDEERARAKRKRKAKRRKADRQQQQIWFGDSCHSCRREPGHGCRVMCSRCPLGFCGACLLKRHGEIIEEQMEESVRWVCPICRGGCGPGCQFNCCTCGPCRKYQDLPPATRILPAMVKAGFDNVHDYLVHFETAEPADVIARRKEGRGWNNYKPAVAVRVGRLNGLHPTWGMKRMRTVRPQLFVPFARLNAKWGTKLTSKLKK